MATLSVCLAAHGTSSLMQRTTSTPSPAEEGDAGSEPPTVNLVTAGSSGLQPTTPESNPLGSEVDKSAVTNTQPSDRVSDNNGVILMERAQRHEQIMPLTPNTHGRADEDK